MADAEELDVEGRPLVLGFVILVLVPVLVGRTSAWRFDGVKVMTPESGFGPCCKVGDLGAQDLWTRGSRGWVQQWWLLIQALQNPQSPLLHVSQDQ